MTVYSDIDDLQALLPFVLSATSLPTITNAAKIQAQAYRLINGLIGVQTPDDDLKAVETDLVIAQILAIHSKKPFPMVLTQEHKIILDDYLEEGLVSINEFYYGYD